MARTRLGRVLPSIRPPRSPSPAAWLFSKRACLSRLHARLNDDRESKRRWLFNPGMQSSRARERSPGLKPANPSSCASACRGLTPRGGCIGPGLRTWQVSRRLEDFALLRSNRHATYHMPLALTMPIYASRISCVARTLANTFKHALIFEALGVDAPRRLTAAVEGPTAQAIQACPWPGGERYNLS